MEKAGIIKDGSFVTDTTQNYTDSTSSIQNLLYFLESRNAIGYLKEYDKNNMIKPPADSLKAFDILEVYRLNTYFPSTGTFKEYNHPKNNTYDITGYDQIIPIFNFDEGQIKEDYIIINESNCILFVDGKNQGQFDLSSFIIDLSNHPQNSNIIEKEFGNYRLKLIITNASGMKKDYAGNALENVNISGYALLKTNTQ